MPIRSIATEQALSRFSANALFVGDEECKVCDILARGSMGTAEVGFVETVDLVHGVALEWHCAGAPMAACSAIESVKGSGRVGRYDFGPKDLVVVRMLVELFKILFSSCSVYPGDT